MLKRIRKQREKSTTSSQPQKRKKTDVGSLLEIQGTFSSQHQAPTSGSQYQNSQYLQAQNNSQLSDESSASSSRDDQMELNTDTNTEPTSIEPRKTRGPTILADIWNLREGEELSEQFNIYNQCVDDGELEYFCGTVARNSNLTPLEFDDWRKVPMEYKDEIWRVVKSKFNLASDKRSWVIKQVGRCLKEFKHTLYCDNFFKYKTLAELKANVDPRTRPDQWVALANKWYSPEWQEKSEKGKKSRAQMKMPHTSGTISFARRAEIELKKTGKRPDRAKLYVDWHKHKDGKPVTTEAAAIIEKIENLRTAKEANGETSQILESFAPLEGDILSQAIGPERHGRVRGMGFGVTPKMFGKANIDTMKEREQEKEEKRILMENYKTLSNEMAQLKELVTKLIGSNVERIGQVPDAGSSVYASVQPQSQHPATD